MLATDPDREATAWQVLSWMREREALKDRAVQRAACHAPFRDPRVRRPERNGPARAGRRPHRKVLSERAHAQ